VTGAADVTVVDDVAAFAGLAGPLLAADPVRHTVQLAVLDRAVRAGVPIGLMLVAREAGRVVGVALSRPGRRLMVSAMPVSCAGPVADLLARVQPGAAGFSGPAPETEAFARIAADRLGAGLRAGQGTRLHALGELVDPTGVPGRARPGGEPDVELLAGWRVGFASEVGGAWWRPLTAQEAVRRSMQVGGAEVIWEVGGTPVAQASAGPVLAGTARIDPVYTPPEQRRHGYAAAVTAAASRWALDAGAQRVLLFTDAANPTTNALYPRIGYRPVLDFAAIDLVPATDAPP
jgi:GNAT superfamily N-acetyltransferase